jgi:hypothetical protein
MFTQKTTNDFHILSQNTSTSTEDLLNKCVELDTSRTMTENILPDFITNTGNAVHNVISRLTNDFYSSNRKHVFFKKNQKQECAEYVLNHFPLEVLIKKTIYVLPDTNSIYIDYPLFKTYGTSQNYEIVVNYLLTEINCIIAQYGSFNMHINLLSFSMSAVERYTQAIQMFCNECFKNVNVKYIDSMDNMYIYNTPNMIGAISATLIRFTNETIKDKMIYYTKEQSNEILEKLIT